MLIRLSGDSQKCSVLQMLQNIIFKLDNTNEKEQKKKKRSCVTRLKMIIRLTLGIPQLHLLNNKKVILMIIMPVNLSLLKKDIHKIFYCFFHNRIKRY